MVKPIAKPTLLHLGVVPIKPKLYMSQQDKTCMKRATHICLALLTHIQFNVIRTSWLLQRCAGQLTDKSFDVDVLVSYNILVACAAVGGDWARQHCILGGGWQQAETGGSPQAGGGSGLSGPDPLRSDQHCLCLCAEE